jgi:transmembrane sensor
VTTNQSPGSDLATPFSDTPSLPELARYFAGDAAPAERSRVEEWGNADPKHARWLEQMVALWTVSAPENWDMESLWARIVCEETDQQDAPRKRLPLVGHVRQVRSTAHYTLLGISAAVIIAAGVSLYRVERPSSVVQRYETAPGQQLTVQLPRAITMMLAPATSVAITQNGIEVLGEAYFAVTPNPNRPLVVHTKHADIRVLGTKFGVRQYPNESISRVFVEDGKIALRPLRGQRAANANANAETVLSGLMAAQVSDSGVDVQHGIAVSDYISRMHGRLVFHDVPLGDVVQELARAYGTDIRLADSALSSQPMTFAASVQDDSIALILRQLAITVRAHVVRSSSGFVIAPGRSSMRAPEIKRFPQQEREYGK